MRRASLTTLILGVTAVAVLTLPAVAAAGTYTWTQPRDFTSASPGANPDHDRYGAKPWSYVEGPPAALFPFPPSLTPSSFTKLSSFSGDIAGGLTGWTDSSDTNAFAALNKGATTLGTVRPGDFALNPAVDHVVALAWTSPLSHSASVTITGSVTAGGGCGAWSLNSGSSALQSGTGSGTISRTAMVPPGRTIYLVVGYTGTQLTYSKTCAISDVSLTVKATETTPPAVTLTSPGQGALLSGGQPLFSGSAATGFGESAHVTVRVYSGASVTGSPTQTLTATRGADGRYSVGPSSPLPDGRYTAQAEQDDLSTPADRGLSSANTFVIDNAPPTITLDPLGSRPLHTATPTLTGTAGTSAGDSDTVTLLVYPGAATSGAPLRTLHSSRGSGGRFSIPITPALPDGQYTAVATQAGGGSTGGASRPLTFSVKVHGPALTLTAPAAGSRVATRAPSFSGVAGDTFGDSSRVTVVLYRGTSTAGKPLGRLRATHSGARWSAQWPRPLPLGRYTARATQSDDAAHTTRTAAHTFTIIQPPNAIGPAVTLSHQGRAAVTIRCLGRGSRPCSGDVLVLTQRHFKTTAGGPSGQLRVLFAYVTIHAGASLVVSRPVDPEVASVLRREAPLMVQVSAEFEPGGSYSGVRTLRLGS